MNPTPAAAFLSSVLIAAPANAEQQRPMTSQDLWAVKRLGAPVLSPDGLRVVFAVQEWSVETNQSVSNLWLVELSGGPPRRLTTARGDDSSPAWSPDGKHLAFVSKRGADEADALYVMPVDGGEAEKILELPFAIVSPKWMPDGRHLVVGTSAIPELAGSWTAEDLAAMTAEVKRRKESQMTAKVTEDRQYRHFDRYLTDRLASRLLKLEVATAGLTDLTPGYDRWFQPDGGVSYDLSPDGTQLAVTMNSTPPPYRDAPNPDLYLLPTDGSGAARLLTPDSPGADGHPVFSPDGSALYFLHSESVHHDGSPSKLWRIDLASGRRVPLMGEIDLSISQARVSPDGATLWLLAEDRGRLPVFRMDAGGGALEAVHAEGTSSRLDARGSTVVFLNSTMNRPDELFALDPSSGEARALTDFNGDLLAQLDFGTVEAFTFEGADGDEVHGWLVRPPGFDPSRTYPLVHMMHGGPHTMAGDAWSHRWNSHLLAAPGHVIVHVNRHGSSGFGERFARSIVNAWGDKPFEDIMKATDHLLETVPNLDPRRLAATGGSYGGYLAAWVLGHTDRFACIINHAGVNNSYSQFAADGPYGFAKVMGGTPWGDVEAMQRNNPMFYARHFKTPTLVIHGELDYRVPYGNGLELYAALQAQAVPSRLVIFPNENHWILSPRNSIHWYWEYHHWLARHLDLPPPEPPVFEALEPVR